jgi:hypothetical protein
MWESLKKLFSGSGNSATVDDIDSGFHTINFDMMLKGNLYERSSGVVRQCSVTVKGATQLVTTGDRVSQEIFDAMVQSGIVLDTSIAPKKLHNTKKDVPTQDSTD